MNDSYQYSYLYKYELNLPEGTRLLTLPRNTRIKIFAITVADIKNEDVIPLQLLYDDFRKDKPVQLRVREYVTADMLPSKYSQKPLFIQSIDARQLVRVKAYLRSIDADTIIVPTPPSTGDYADKNSGNGVTATYYATGKSKKGREYKNEKIDISNILDSRNGKLKDTVLFDNGEGRIVVDLGKAISVGKINIYFDQFRNRGSQIFTIWTSLKESSANGNPVADGWQYIGPYGISGRAISSAGTSLVFENGLQCRYIMLVSDGNWHGTEYLKQLDIIEKR
jgi:hypothetical protein